MGDSKKIKILYIEDDLSSRILIRKVLDRPPFRYYEAADGLSGLQLAQKEKPHLILMDINLPDISGNELTTKIKNTEELKDIVIVALTAYKGKYARELTLTAGCEGFFTKPVDVQKFPEQLLQFLEGKRELVEQHQKDFFHNQYEKTLVDHLTSKVQELELSNRKLEKTTRSIQEYNKYLENVLSILSRLQTCSTPMELRKNLIDEICKRFRYDRCVFIDVDPESGLMHINYARGIDPEDWDKYSYPFNNPFFQRLFRKKQVILVPHVNRVEDPELRQRLIELNTNQFIFAYLGTPMYSRQSADMRKNVLPLLESFHPTLYDHKDLDINIILENLGEYMASEALYRGGFVFLDNCYSERRIASNEYRFLETLFRTTSYMYQNLLLMDHLRYLFVRAEKEAITDPLTNLFNYRYLIQQLKREISRDKRHKSLFSLIIIDIDFFKKYNDAFGHQAGDLILRKIAQTMLKNTRSSDLVSRYGGEEFVIICPELNKQGAFQMAEKLRQIIEQMNFPHRADLPDGKLTVSLGVATFPEDGETAYRLIRNADKALYKAKNDGRNKVCVS